MRTLERLQSRIERISRRRADDALRYAAIIAAGPAATDQELDELLELARTMGVNEARVRADLAARERYEQILPLASRRQSAEAEGLAEHELASLVDAEIELGKLVAAAPWLYRTPDGRPVLPSTPVAGDALPLTADGSALAFDVPRVRSIDVGGAYTRAELEASYGLTAAVLSRAALPRMPGHAELYYGASLLAWADGCVRTFVAVRRRQLGEELEQLGRPLPDELFNLPAVGVYDLPAKLLEHDCRVMRARVETQKEHLQGQSADGRATGEAIAGWARGVEARRARTTAALGELDQLATAG